MRPDNIRRRTQVARAQSAKLRTAVRIRSAPPHLVSALLDDLGTIFPKRNKFSRYSGRCLDSPFEFQRLSADRKGHKPCLVTSRLPNLTKGAYMSCGRCGTNMHRTELYLSQTRHLEIKTVFAWRCDHCGRIECYGGSSTPDARSNC